jgi:hypothetical protein
LTLFLALGCLATPVLAADYNVSVRPTSTEEQHSLSVTTGDVVLIKAPSGAVAVVQFTNFGPHTASYRWRYRAAKQQSTVSGNGSVRESYNRKLNAHGAYDVTPTLEHDTTVRAGELSIEWSYGSEKNGWLYYYPSRATIELTGADSFAKDL